MSDDVSYPIIIEERTRYLVWVEGAHSAGSAYRMVCDYPAEYLHGNPEPFDACLVPEKPDGWAMYDVYNYAAPDQDAHVRTHRSAWREASS